MILHFGASRLRMINGTVRKGGVKMGPLASAEMCWCRVLRRYASGGSTNYAARRSGLLASDRFAGTGGTCSVMCDPRLSFDRFCRQPTKTA
jgi:hypothetical protein